MVTITEDIDLPGGADPKIGVEVSLSDTAGRGQVGFSDAKTIMSYASPTLASGATWSLDLTPNSDITNPTGTIYRRRVRGGADIIADNLFDVPTTELNLTTNVTSASRVSNVVTLTMATTAGYEIGDTVIVDLADDSYDGTFTLTNVTGTTLVYSQTASDAGTTTGTVGRPWRLAERLVTGPVSLPLTDPTNEYDFVKLTSDSGGITLTGGFDVVAVPNTVVTVPDVARPIIITGNISISHSVATSNVPIGIGPTGLGAGQVTSLIAASYVHVHTAGTGVVYTAFIFARLPANSPGDYQVYGNAPAGTLTVRGSTFAPSTLSVLGV